MRKQKKKSLRGVSYDPCFINECSDIPIETVKILCESLDQSKRNDKMEYDNEATTYTTTGVRTPERTMV